MKLSVLFLFLSFTCWGQNNIGIETIFACKSQIITIDSSYYLVLTFSINNEDTVHIRRNRQYSIQSEDDVDEIQFWRVTRGWAIRQCRDYLSQPILGYVNPYSLYITKDHPFQDTVLLDGYLPFDNGEYIVSAFVSFKYKGEINRKMCDPVRFFINFIPRQSLKLE